MKINEFKCLINDLGNCTKCTNMKCAHKSLINIFKDKEFCMNIPSIWTDWFNRLDADIMIIGQDWGPYVEMKKFYDRLNHDKSNWKRLINSEESLTKKRLECFIRESSNNTYSLDDIYVTNAIMCARSGVNYRSNNIDLKKSTLNCSEFLYRQIDIVKPRVILTLGYYPLLSLSKIFNFNIYNTLSECIKNLDIINVDDYVIIPLYHPVAQIKSEEQLEQYRKIWKYISR